MYNQAINPQCVSAISLNSTFIRIGIVLEVSFFSPSTVTLLSVEQEINLIIVKVDCVMDWYYP